MVLKDLLFMREAGILHSVPPETLRAVLGRFQQLVYKDIKRMTKNTASGLHARHFNILWLRSIDIVARNLPANESRRLRAAMEAVRTPLCLPGHKIGPHPDGLLSQWAFVMKLSAVETFWNLHRRCPKPGSRPRDPEEGLLGETLMRWRAENKKGTLHEVRRSAACACCVHVK